MGSIATCTGHIDRRIEAAQAGQVKKRMAVWDNGPKPLLGRKSKMGRHLRLDYVRANQESGYRKTGLSYPPSVRTKQAV